MIWLLLLTNKNVDGGAGEVPALTNLIFEEAFIGLLDVLRQVGIEDKAGNTGIRQLSTVLDLYVLTLHGRWRICLNER